MPSSSNFIPYGKQHIDDEDIAAVIKVLKSDHLTSGPVTEDFEAALTKLSGVNYGVSCSSGTAALHLAVMAAEIGPGDIVIVPSITFLATANVARYVGADVVFADVDPDTGLMRPSDLIQALEIAGPKAKAVIPVHLAGQCVDMAEIYAIAQKHDLIIIEDACHALGTITHQNDQKDVIGSCTHSHMAAFSFHPVKTIAMGEGGAVMTNDPALAERLHLFRNHGMTRDSKKFLNTDMALNHNGETNSWFYEMHSPGYNYRASEIHCALGLSQLGKLDKVVAARQDLVKQYDQALIDLAPILNPLSRAVDNDPAWHLYIVLIDFEKIKIDRTALITLLREKGIGSQVHYIPVHLQPYYKNLYGQQHLPGADRYYQRCLSLPLFPTMRNQDVDRVVTTLRNIIIQ
jgi:UDP-4-amino-4,6-dideoxy-N-acetyl-beta-L-altrosamine transaminase